ncbi:hypothetical protein DSO57_1039729 [Entomophthora muscae]|uniref:Uncharacterized protein n=1 Tax=Entomophthora muscae TaxID=34485 RepID=A0ACC2TY25_9FUNG|nr:hypothetical protein DSO57_1039729 [Entomophthora muscae]
MLRKHARSAIFAYLKEIIIIAYSSGGRLNKSSFRSCQIAILAGTQPCLQAYYKFSKFLIPKQVSKKCSAASAWLFCKQVYFRSKVVYINYTPLVKYKLTV